MVSTNILSDLKLLDGSVYLNIDFFFIELFAYLFIVCFIFYFYYRALFLYQRIKINKSIYQLTFLAFLTFSCSSEKLQELQDINSQLQFENLQQ